MSFVNTGAGNVAFLPVNLDVVWLQSSTTEQQLAMDVPADYRIAGNFDGGKF